MHHTHAEHHSNHSVCRAETFEDHSIIAMLSEDSKAEAHGPRKVCPTGLVLHAGDWGWMAVMGGVPRPLPSARSGRGCASPCSSCARMGPSLRSARSHHLALEFPSAWPSRWPKPPPRERTAPAGTPQEHGFSRCYYLESAYGCRTVRQ